MIDDNFFCKKPTIWSYKLSKYISQNNYQKQKKIQILNILYQIISCIFLFIQPTKTLMNLVIHYFLRTDCTVMHQSRQCYLFTYSVHGYFLCVSSDYESLSVFILRVHQLWIKPQGPQHSPRLLLLPMGLGSPRQPMQTQKSSFYSTNSNNTPYY